MFKIISITQRSLCKDEEAFLSRIEEIARSDVDTLILREKDLSPPQYKKLGLKVLKVCEAHGTECLLHQFVEVAESMGHLKIHLPLPVFEANPNIRETFQIIGVSVHSVEQAQKALSLGADYLTAGHVFTTDCKKDLLPRGLSFLKNICALSNKPVYAIGGINEKNILQTKEAGAKGACIMSGLMKAPSVDGYLGECRENLFVRGNTLG